VTAQRSSLYDAPVVAQVIRSGFIESVHHGSVVALDADGSTLLAIGDVAGPIFPRSASKPIQALAMLRAGLDLSGELLALAAASHSGERFHLDGVERILEGAGLTEQGLQNTPDLPYDGSPHTSARVCSISCCNGGHRGVELLQRRIPVHPGLDPGHGRCRRLCRGRAPRAAPGHGARPLTARSGKVQLTNLLDPAVRVCPKDGPFLDVGAFAQKGRLERIGLVPTPSKGTL
jgi:hypothetical protein